MLTQEEFDELLKVLNDSLYHETHIWDVMNSQYYHNMIKISLLPNTIINNKLCTNNNKCDVNNNDNNFKIFGEIDILLNPSFDVMCPYIRLWTVTGSILSFSEVQTFMMSRFNSNEVEMFIEEHPISGIPCYTFHVCGIREILMTMETYNIKGNGNIRFLSWLSIIGKYIGLQISYNDFHKMQSKYHDGITNKLNDK